MDLVHNSQKPVSALQKKINFFVLKMDNLK